jgi:chemotaxis family two-component system response regulator PixG
LDSIISAPDIEDQFSILIQILNQGLIEREQLAQLMTSVATEILFDVIQISQIKDASLSCELVADDPNGKFNSLLPSSEINPVLKQAVQNWQQWQSQGLANCSPNLFPVIEKSQHLENPSFSEAQKSILALVDGLHNLRGIAAIANVEMIKLTKFLSSLVKLGAISFSPVPVAKKSQLADSGKNIPVVTSPTKDVLIACVDDSPTVCQGLEKIVQRQGYRFLGVQDSAKAVPLLLKNKPDFLFLDLVMPIANGYEICAQLRKIPSFKDLPIVILTGKDGLVDRMRAKMVGSTDFLSKPVQVGDVVKIIEKYLTSVESS